MEKLGISIHFGTPLGLVRGVLFACKIHTAPQPRAVGRRRSASPAAAQQPAADASQPRKHGGCILLLLYTAIGGTITSAPRFSNTAAAATTLQHCAHCLISVSWKLSPSRIMSSGSFWSDACKNAKDKPLQTLLDVAYGSCGATVRPARAADCAPLAAV